MRAVIFFGEQDVRLVDRPVPQPGEGQVRLKVALAGVCATDRHIVAGHFAVRPPRVLGHELAGSVDALGPGVDRAWLGQPCGVRPARFCGRCSMCQSGAPQLCQNFACLGNTQDGGYAEYTLVPADQLVPLADMGFETAVWLEPLACVLQALEQAGGAALRGPVLVLGAGVLGKLMLQALLALVDCPVAVIDPNPERVHAAIRLGAQAGWTVPRQGPTPEADLALQAWAPGGPALVIDTSGAAEAIRRAVLWAGPRGKVLLFGVSDPIDEVCLSPQAIFSKELCLLASSGMAPASFDAALALLRERRLDPTAQGMHRFDLEALPAHLLGQAERVEGKLIVRPGGRGEGQP